MSWWTEIRDGLETAAGIVLNYYYPGSGILGQWVNSKGSQQQLYGTEWGQGALALGGLAGGYSGNFANYTGGAESAGGTLGGAGGGSGSDWTPGGYGGSTANAGAQQLDPQAVQYAQSLMQGGMPADQAYIEAGIAPGDMGGASPVFEGQQGFGSSGSPGSFNASGSPASNSLGGGASAASNVARSTGALPWGSPGNVATMGQGTLGLLGAAGLMQAGQRAQQQADPFGPYRKQYADQLAALQADPSSVTKLPGYQAGIEAIKRSMAAQGFTGSGNMLGALAKYGGDFYNQAVNMYSGLAGAQFNPASGAQLGLQGTSMGLSLAGQSLNRLGYGSYMAGNQWPWEQKGG